MAGVPARPTFSSLPDYGQRLGEAGFWRPYVQAVLARHGTLDAEPVAGFVGTYPTFLAGQVVVKLFGWFRSWRRDHRTELAAHQLLAAHPDIPAPRLLAHGHLYGEPDPWPYLVTQRLPGRSLREASLSRPQRQRVAAQIGQVLRRLHDLPVPTSGPLARDWLREHRPGCAERHRAWGSLKTSIVDGLDAYVVPPGPARLVHADLTAEHLFVHDGDLVGIIDWGDAMTTDPHYDLGPLHLGAFGADTALLAAFLTGYGWQIGGDFRRGAMSAAVCHQHDLFTDLALTPDRFSTIDELAAAVWDPVAGEPAPSLPGRRRCR